MDRENLISKLLLDFHLNNYERKLIKNIEYKEICRFLESYFSTNKIYPPKASIWKKNEAVYEGGFIEKISKTLFRVHYQRSYANNPYLLAESKHLDFPDLESALKVLLSQEWKNSIDGISIIY